MTRRVATSVKRTASAAIPEPVVEEATIVQPVEKPKRTRSPKTDKPKAEKPVAEEKPKRTRAKKAAEQPVEEKPAEQPVVQFVPKKVRAGTKFNPSSIVNFMRTHYRLYPTIDNIERKSVNIKLIEDFDAEVDTGAETESKKRRLPAENCINLNDYSGVLEFIQTYIAIASQTHEKEFKLQKVIESIFDIRMRGALDIVDLYDLKQDEPKKALQDFVLSRLGFNTTTPTPITSYIEAITEFMKNESKLRTKAYNTFFPHSTRSGADAKGVNVVYLQHSPAFQNELLEKLAEDIDIDDMKLDAIVIKNFVDQHSNMQACLLNPAIRKGVDSPPKIVNKNGVEVVDALWVKKLKRCVIKGNKPVQTDETVSAEEAEVIQQLVKELTLARQFVKVVRDAFENGKMLVKEDGVDKTVDDKRSIDECVDKYNAALDAVRLFNAEWVKRAVDGKFKDVAAETKFFIEYFVAACKFMKEHFGYVDPIKTFVCDIKRVNLNLNFSKEIKAGLVRLVNEKLTKKDSDEIVKSLTVEHLNDWRYINVMKSQDPLELDIYNNIGKICGISIGSDYRIAVGIAVVAWIQEKIRLISARNCKKRDITIGIYAGDLMREIENVVAPFREVAEEKPAEA